MTRMLMTRILVTRILWCALVITAVLLQGCASTAKQGAEEVEDPINREATIESFQQRCDESILQAAVARWDEGDASGCQLMLEQQLQRRPNHLAARFMLADVYMALGNVPDAENQLRWIIQQNPYNPQGHHSLGLLLETSGRHDEAMALFHEAARLAPHNELYALSAQAAGR